MSALKVDSLLHVLRSAPSAASGVTAPILPPAEAAANKNAAKTSTLVRRQPPLRTRWNVRDDGCLFAAVVGTAMLAGVVECWARHATPQLIPCFLMLAYLAS